MSHQSVSTEPVLAALEAAYLDARSARDRLDLARATGDPPDPAELEAASQAAFDVVRAAFEGLRALRRTLGPDDRAVVAAMLAGIERAEAYLLPGVVPGVDAGTEDDAGDAGDDGGGSDGDGSTSHVAPSGAGVAPATRPPSVDHATTELVFGVPDAGPNPTHAGWSRGRRDDTHEAYHHDRLRLEAAYTEAAGSLTFEGRSYTRLQLLARLGTEPDAARRRELFLALSPLWRAVDASGGPESPYRALIGRSAIRWRGGRSPIAANARALGVAEADVAAWATTVLAGWRHAFVEAPRGRAEALIEPWDWWWRAGEAYRELRAHLPLGSLVGIDRAYHRSLGADLDALNVTFDIHPRSGRPPVPVAYTTFGERPHRLADGSWHPGRPTILETLVDGGLGELGELLHETGHAIHIAGIRTRPAFADWPDSDALTEAIADLLALDAFDPRWHRRWIPGAPAVDPRTGVRARYAEVALDAAWALFEIRLHQDPGLRPNDLWTDLTRTWLGIAPHGEWSWWAMRGQLLEDPGYMANYAIGAVLAADLRAAIRRERGEWIDGDSGWYPWVRDHLYQFGASRPAGAVLEGVLGRPPTADALLAHLTQGGEG